MFRRKIATLSIHQCQKYPSDLVPSPIPHATTYSVILSGQEAAKLTENNQYIIGWYKAN
jgi:hypothetical protein